MIVPKDEKSINLREKHYSGLEMARILNVPYDTLQRYVDKHWLPDTRSKAGGQWLWTQYDLDHCRECRTDSREEAAKKRAYFALETASLLGISLNEIPGLVAMGIMNDWRLTPEARNEWMFYWEDLESARDYLMEKRREERHYVQAAQDARRERAEEERAAVETTMQEESQAQTSETTQSVEKAPEVAHKKRAPAIREETPTGGRWANPHGERVTREQAASLLGISVDTIESYCRPSVGYKLPDRRDRTPQGDIVRGAKFWFYQSDIDEFERHRNPAPVINPNPPKVKNSSEQRSEEANEGEHSMNAVLVESPEKAPQSSPFPTQFNQKISALAGLLVHLQVVEGALDIQAVDEKEVSVSVSLPEDALTRRIHVEIALHVEPKIRVWEVFMSTPTFPQSEPYQAVYVEGAYHVIHLDTAPE